MAVQVDGVITATGNGASSDVVFIPAGGRWVLQATCGTWGGASAALETSSDGTTWYPSRQGESGTRVAIAFTEDDAYDVAGNMYYRLNVTGYANPITLTPVQIESWR